MAVQSSHFVIIFPFFEGTGKTEAIKALLDLAEAYGQQASIIVLAPTAAAAKNVEGDTIHSKAAISINFDLLATSDDTKTVIFPSFLRCIIFLCHF